MDLVSTLNPGRICYVGDQVYFVKAISLIGRAQVLAWLDDILPGKPDRVMPPEMGSDEAQAALNSGPGKLLLTWIALRDSGLSYNDCAVLDISDVEQYLILERLFTSRRTAAPSIDTGGDIAHTWTGENMAALATEIGLEALGQLSNDQYEWMMSRGNVDPEHDPQARGFRVAMAAYNAAMARDAEVKAAEKEAADTTEMEQLAAMMAAAEAELNGAKPSDGETGVTA